MREPRGFGGTISSRRAQSTLIGVVLLIGMVATASVGIFLVAGEAISGAEQQSEQERVEQAFIELSQNMETTSSSGDTTRSMNFEVGKSGAITQTEAGTITLHAEHFNNSSKYGGTGNPLEIPIGAVEYDNPDGPVVAYQAGGVWRGTGENTQMLSAPTIHFKDETLSLPVITVSEEQQLRSGELSLNYQRTNAYGSIPVENETVRMTIQSDYYRGWETFFRTEAGDASIEEIDPDSNSVTVRLGYEEIENAFDNGATIASSDDRHFHDQHDNIGDDSARGVPLPEMDSVIEEMVADAKSGNVDGNLSAGYNNVSNGTYYIDEIASGDEIDADLSDGNVTILVESDVYLDESIRVVDRDAAEKNELRIYSNGDRFNLDGEICVGESTCEGTTDVVQFYGPSTMGVDLGPSNSGTFEGVLYVASSEEKVWLNDGNGKCDVHHQVHMQANSVEFTGSMVAYSVCAHSSSVDFSYDEDLQDANIDPYPEGYSLPPQITYLNIAEHIIDITEK